MKKHVLILMVFALTAIVKSASAQTDTPSFTGAKAKLQHYNALYVINSNDDKRIRGLFTNMKNVMNDVRLKGKLHLELIAFGDGVAVYMKNGPYEQALRDLLAKGVVLAQCHNTLIERHIDRSEIFPFVALVPSGNGEIVLRFYDGWAVVHP